MFKKLFFGLFLFLLSPVFVAKTFAMYNMYIAPTATPTQAPVRTLQISTSTPTPTAAPTLAPIRYIPVSTSTPTPTQAQIKYVPLNTTTNLRTISQTPKVSVQYPSSASVALNGQLEQFLFNVTGLSKGTSYQYRLELWRNGNLLGPIFHPALGNIDPSSSYQSAGELAGRYWPQGATKAAMADAGSGYSIHAVLVQNGNDITFGAGPVFSYTSGNFQVNPKIVITSPNGGESYATDGSIKYIEYSISGFDPYKSGNYFYQIFLYKDGKELGPVGGATPYLLNNKLDNDILGYLSGEYYSNGIKVAQAGGGYTVKMVVTYKDQVVAQDSSDNTFSFTSSSNQNQPLVHVLSPNGGEVIPLDGTKTQNILFEQKNLDPYYGGSYYYTVELLRNEKILGYLVSSNPFQLNNKETSSALGFKAEKYIDIADKSQKNIESGGGYKVLVTIYKQNTPILTDESDITFSFGSGIGIYAKQVIDSVEETIASLIHII